MSIYIKVREGQVAQYNFLLVVGLQEIETKTVNVRTRENEVKGALSLDAFLALLKDTVEKFE